MTPEQVDKLIDFGKMALEQGWYDQARDHFEQALALDASNREAMKGLARANEILSRKAAAAVKPVQVEPVAPPRKVERKRSIPEKKREGRVGSPMRWFKRQSRLNKIAVLISMPLLSCLLCLTLSEFISPTQEPTPLPTRATVTPASTIMTIPPTEVLLPPTPTAEPPTTTPILPAKTPVPPTPVPVSAEPKYLLKKDLDMALDRGGVVIRLRVIGFVLMEGMPAEFHEGVSYFSAWEDVVTVGLIDLSVTNTTDKKVSVYPDQGTVVAGDEQVDVDIWLSEDVGGDYFAGVMKQGSVLFGLKRADVTALDSVRYVVNAPFEAERFESLGEDYEFVIPLR